MTRRIPTATYRLQLHKGFTFDDAAAIADYLSELGISHVYCSPYLQAAPGSMHGYDVVDPQRINEELGGAAAHERFWRPARRARPRPGARHRAQSHVAGRRRTATGGTCWRMAPQPLRHLLRHRLESAGRAAAGQGSGAYPRRSVRARPARWRYRGRRVKASAFG